LVDGSDSVVLSIAGDPADDEGGLHSAAAHLRQRPGDRTGQEHLRRRFGGQHEAGGGATLALPASEFVPYVRSCSQIIVTCIFANFEKFCGFDQDTAGFTTFINNVRWDLAEVPWDWSATP
jgi:hypothetical protein